MPREPSDPDEPAALPLDPTDALPSLAVKPDDPAGDDGLEEVTAGGAEEAVAVTSAEQRDHSPLEELPPE